MVVTLGSLTQTCFLFCGHVVKAAGKGEPFRCVFDCGGAVNCVSGGLGLISSIAVQT